MNGNDGESTRAAGRISANRTGADCIGPIAIPPDLTRKLDDLARGAEVDGLIPFWVCAVELVRRTAHSRPAPNAHVIRGAREGGSIPSGLPCGEPTSFRAALRCAAAPAPAPWTVEHAAPADVTLLVSNDGNRLYVERTSTIDTPNLHAWARSYLRLLRTLADRPDAPLLASSVRRSGSVRRSDPRTVLAATS